LQDIFSQSADAVFAIDGTRRIVYQNRMLSEIVQPATPAPARRQCHEVLCGRAPDGQDFCHSECPVGASLVNGQSVDNFDLMVPRSHNDLVHLNIGAMPVTSSALDGVAAIFVLRPIGIIGTPASPAGDSMQSDDGAPDLGQALTRREQQILSLLTTGIDTQALAGKLNISYVTVRNHIQRIYQKLGIHSRAEAVSYAYRNSLLR
jgi:DNA-binding CsgD family transcriptional regulator